MSGLSNFFRISSGVASRPDPSTSARFARPRDIRMLNVRGPTKGRVVIGRCGRHTIAAEAGHSLLVVGPTQSGKTTRLAAPAITEWEGPVVAASVKGDLARMTMEARSKTGEVLLYDPLRTTGLPTAAWSPLPACSTWTGARRTSADLAAVARESAANMNDGDFWYSMAAKLLAPLFLAAATNGLSMTDVVQWVDEQNLVLPLELLNSTHETQAVQALRATLGRDERQRSAVFTTAETVIEAFADPDVAASESPAVDPWWQFQTANTNANAQTTVQRQGTIHATRLLDGNNTLYLCAPTYDQRRLRALFATLVTQV
ncbi:MAG: type IV secretory system conjugative DNA transfer family protein, partial [Acidimicrobiales bacterium]